jgi:hypothetical protein
MIQTFKKGKDLSIIIWSTIWIGGRSDLVIINRDKAAGGSIRRTRISTYSIR